MTPDPSPPSRLPHVTVSVPGKTILFGEHAAVYGRPALIAALDLRVRVEATATESASVHLDLPALEYQGEHGWDEILAYTAEKRRRWEAYAAAPSPEAFQAVRDETRAHAALIALGEAAAALPGPPPGLAIRVDSEIPIGSGFGSSAAVAVGLVTAVLVHGRGLPSGSAALERIRHLSLEAERRQHGTPSGIDNATVIHGGVVLAEKPPGEDAFVLSPIAAPRDILESFRLFHTGSPAESTGEVVAAVRALQEREPETFESALDAIEEATRGFAIELARTHTLHGAAIPLVRQCQGALEALGVVPEAVRHLVRQVEAAGGAAKISGAGALTGAGGGALLVYHPQPGVVEAWDFLRELTPIPARLGAEGVRWE